MGPGAPPRGQPTLVRPVPILDGAETAVQCRYASRLPSPATPDDRRLPLSPESQRRGTGVLRVELPAWARGYQQRPPHGRSSFNSQLRMVMGTKPHATAEAVRTALAG